MFAIAMAVLPACHSRRAFDFALIPRQRALMHPAAPLFTTRLLAVCTAVLAMTALPGTAATPNVILIMVDDMGYGDMGAHGHPHLTTPNMDRLWRDSVRLEDFHVDPTCSPTRSALMTGRYSGRVGVWHTIMSRYLLREDETVVAQIFKDAGYRTAMFGKWHLGDTFPYSPRFRGFYHTVVHGGGGVGQTPDFWGNDYEDDTYNHNGVWRSFEGYCTDVWFREALNFIDEGGDEPFFVYLPTNVAHQTRRNVPDRYRDLYADVDTTDTLRTFWGMLSNLDENLGAMLEHLETSGLLENTVLVFMSDNGTCMNPNAYPQRERDTWSETYNAGMRGTKGSIHDGGHRVFCFVHYPAGGLTGGREVRRITAHIDIAPTLLDLCGIEPPVDLAFDGRSLAPLLRDPETSDWPDRTLVVESQRVIHPEKWRNTSVMTDRWRLVNNRELHDIRADPGQSTNLIAQHPEVAAELAAFYNTWWDDVSSRHDETSLHYIGAEQENPVQLNAHDWMPPMEGRVPPWNQPMIVNDQGSNGTWYVRVVQHGRYAFTLRERPGVVGFTLSAAKAHLRVGDHERLLRAVEEGATGVRFEVDLPAGDTSFKTWLIDEDGNARGAYFVEIERLEPDDE